LARAGSPRRKADKEKHSTIVFLRIRDSSELGLELPLFPLDRVGFFGGRRKFEARAEKLLQHIRSICLIDSVP
jgi:hypothetical protein